MCDEQDAQKGDAALIKAFLANRDVPCPRCRYNLRLQQRAICPECGLRLSLSIRPNENLFGPWVTAMSVLGAMAGLGMFFLTLVLRWGFPDGAGWTPANVVLVVYMLTIPLAIGFAIYRRRFVRLPRSVQHAAWMSAAMFAAVMLATLIAWVQ